MTTLWRLCSVTYWKAKSINIIALGKFSPLGTFFKVVYTSTISSLFPSMATENCTVGGA